MMLDNSAAYFIKYQRSLRYVAKFINVHYPSGEETPGVHPRDDEEKNHSGEFEIQRNGEIPNEDNISKKN
jgi:hypothetical protein